MLLREPLQAGVEPNVFFDCQPRGGERGRSVLGSAGWMHLDSFFFSSASFLPLKNNPFLKKGNQKEEFRVHK